jgi:hypothetical protein
VDLLSSMILLTAAAVPQPVDHQGLAASRHRRAPVSRRVQRPDATLQDTLGHESRSTTRHCRGLVRARRTGTGSADGT